MTKTAVLLGGDRRQSCLARQLQACGFAVRTCGVPGCPDTAHTLPACVRGAELLILPMPALRAPDRIRAAPDDLPLAPTLDAAAPDALVCGGLLDAAVPALQAHSLRWFDYARDETLALENAELTARCEELRSELDKISTAPLRLDVPSALPTVPFPETAAQTPPAADRQPKTKLEHLGDEVLAELSKLMPQEK